MPSSSTVLDRLSGEDHWVSLAISLLVMVLLGVLLNIQLFGVLVIGAIVSGIVEMAIKEVPPNPENYDEDQYVLWDAAFGEETTSTEELQEKVQEREGNEKGQKSSEDQPAGLDTLRDRYARGELTEKQFERKVERLLETETLEDGAEDRRTSELLTERESDNEN